MKFLSKLFGAPEEINGRDRCPTYLYRWTILKRKDWSVYIHHFVGDDWSNDLHDHPKRFISIGLWGWYLEHTPKFRVAWKMDGTGEMWGTRDCVFTETKKYHAPWFRTFPADHIHRIQTPSKNCWTLVIVLKATRPWGFWHEGKFIPWREYVDSKLADVMKACD